MKKTFYESAFLPIQMHKNDENRKKNVFKISIFDSQLL